MNIDNIFNNTLESLNKKDKTPERLILELKLETLKLLSPSSSLNIKQAEKELKELLEIERPIINLKDIENHQFRLNFKKNDFKKIYEKLMKTGFELSPEITNLENLKKTGSLMVNFGIIERYSHTKAWFPELFYTEEIFTNKRPLKHK
jgi:hypothetical protein